MRWERERERERKGERGERKRNGHLLLEEWKTKKELANKKIKIIKVSRIRKIPSKKFLKFSLRKKAIRPQTFLSFYSWGLRG